MKKTLLKMVLGAWCLVLGGSSAMAAVEPLKELTAIQIADSATTWLDVRKAKTYQLEDTIPVSHSASNWVNAAAVDLDATATVTWADGDEVNDQAIRTDDAPLTVTLKSPGEYRFTHTAADGSSVSTNITVVKRQLGTKDEPWIISEEDDLAEVRAFMLSETELCIEGDGITMLDFGGCGPWGENVRSVYFDNPPQNRLLRQPAPEHFARRISGMHEPVRGDGQGGSDVRSVAQAQGFRLF